MTDQKTPLYTKHIAMGAHMVAFHGTLLPVRFNSEIDEHNAVRNGVGIFDVSHMGEVFVEGYGAAQFLQHLLTNNIDTLAVGHAHYSLMLNQQAGIIDDLIVYRLSEQRYLLCINAGNIDRDWAHIAEHAALYQNCRVINASNDFAQFALQGPKSAALLAKFTSGGPLPVRFGVEELALNGIATIVARTGYTGSDGFEIFVNQHDALSLYEQFLFKGAEDHLTPCGLASRDSLRLEAGMLLHGQDMDETTTPNDVGLNFAVDRTKPDFIGKRALMKHVPTTKLVGFQLLDRGLARHGFSVVDENFKSIGAVTSATYLAERKLSVGFAQIIRSHSTINSRCFVDIRGRNAAAIICSMRFLKR